MLMQQHIGNGAFQSWSRGQKWRRPMRGSVQAASKPTLYTNPGSRGKIVEWYAAELGLDMELKTIDMRGGEHKRPEFLRVNPFGKVPALEDGDIKVFESGAILLYLATRYGSLAQDVAAQATAAQWTLWANSTFMESWKQPSALLANLQTLDRLLEGQQYLSGAELGVGDLAVGSYLLYLPMFFPGQIDYASLPNIWGYMQRLAARPACPTPYKEALAGAEAEVQKKQGGILSKLGIKT